MNNQKYFGILKTFDFKKINKDNFQLLIDNGLFDVHDLSACYVSDEDYFGLELETDDWDFSDFFLFNRKEYHLKKEIYDELYQSDRNLIEDDNDPAYSISQIDYEVEKEFNEQRKLVILEHYYKKYFSAIKDKELYLLYKNNTKKHDCNTFADYYRENIQASEDYRCIAQYLKGAGTYYNKELKEAWELMFLIANVCDFCVRKKHELANPLQKTQVISEAETIFIDDGESIFSFIMSKYSGNKNPAFFSYLFSYLKENNKTISKGKDSKEYRNYILRNYKIKMSRIIETSANNQFKKDEMFIKFSNYMQSYSVNN